MSEMQATLEIKWDIAGKWQVWNNHSPKINIDYRDEREPFYVNRYTIGQLFQEPVVTVDGFTVWDYRINKTESFRERRDSCDRCE